MSEPSKNKLIEFFNRNPNPEDDKLHSFAEGHGWSPHETEDKAYELATAQSKLLRNSVADKAGKTKADVNPSEYAKGMDVEKEHTDDPGTAEQITLDHLTEMPNYYTELAKMEKKSSIYRLGYIHGLQKLGMYIPEEKVAWAFGPWGNEKGNFKTKASGGSGSVKKEYLRLRDLASEYPKPGNKTKFERFKKEVSSAGIYPIEDWEKEEPHTGTALTGIRWS